MLPIISVLAENTLLKTAYHFLLLLVGFDTLTYRKDYDRSPILVGHHYVKGTRWRRIDQIGGAEFDFRFSTYLELRKWLRALEHITKHLEQVDH